MSRTAPLALALALLVPALLAAQPPAPVAVEVRMQDHHRYASSLQAEVAQGHLDVARDLARKLESLDPEAVGEPLRPGLEVLRERARAVVSSPDLPSAAAATARLGSACGGCHAHLERGPLSRPTSLPPPQWTEGQGMVRHQWAADWMWVGLVAPSAEAWSRGAHDLATVPLPHGDAATQEELRRLAVAAESATSPDARAEAFGKVLARCAACHSAAAR